MKRSRLLTERLPSGTVVIGIEAGNRAMEIHFTPSQARREALRILQCAEEEE